VRAEDGSTSQPATLWPSPVRWAAECVDGGRFADPRRPGDTDAPRGSGVREEACTSWLRRPLVVGRFDSTRVMARASTAALAGTHGRRSGRDIGRRRSRDTSHKHNVGLGTLVGVISEYALWPRRELCSTNLIIANSSEAVEAKKVRIFCGALLLK